jgi:hypothetical protein
MNRCVNKRPWLEGIFTRVLLIQIITIVLVYQEKEYDQIDDYIQRFLPSIWRRRRRGPRRSINQPKVCSTSGVSANQEGT